MIVKLFLVISANGDARIAKRPRLSRDEVGFPLNVTIPDGWGRITNQPINVTLPEPPGNASVGDAFSSEES